MRVSELISKLTAVDPTLEVLLTVADEPGISVHGRVVGVTVEDDHGTEDLFVRISGDTEDPLDVQTGGA